MEIVSKAAQARGMRDGLRLQLKTLKREAKSLEDEVELLLAVSTLLRTLIDTEVESGVKAVEVLLTEGLQTVFDDQDLSVRADLSIQRGKVSVDLVTCQKLADGSVVEGLPLDAFGGSVLTIQSILLRVIVMLRRDLRRFVLLDEALSAFDSNYITNVGSFLSELCHRLDVDMLMVTHNPALFESADVAYRTVRTANETAFTRVHG